MKKTITFILLCFLFFIVNCRGRVLAGQHALTRENIRTLLSNPSQSQVKLIAETLEGCVHIPATNLIQRRMVGFERTGEKCSVTVSKGNIVEVDFLGDSAIPLVDNTGTDVFVGELGLNQVLIVQHRQGKVVSVTQTVYDKNGAVVYGRSGQGEYIKECIFIRTTSEKLAGEMNCGG